jgi:hypothetical protein
MPGLVHLLGTADIWSDVRGRHLVSAVRQFRGWTTKAGPDTGNSLCRRPGPCVSLGKRPVPSLGFRDPDRIRHIPGSPAITRSSIAGYCTDSPEQPGSGRTTRYRADPGARHQCRPARQLPGRVHGSGMAGGRQTARRSSGVGSRRCFGGAPPRHGCRAAGRTVDPRSPLRAVRALSCPRACHPPGLTLCTHHPSRAGKSGWWVHKVAVYGARAGGIGTPGCGEEVSAMSSQTVVPPVRGTRG